ncbi:MAG: sigma-70 family RNA polymerase sigma factor [Anaerolineae bacterium]|nr:sigma-70 family RNA polymerase sigma factor [Anaerolineae bacterium]
MSASSTDALIIRAQQGDAEAVATLYRDYAQAIYRYIAYRVSNAADAEDLTAEVFLKMVEGLPGYRLTGAPFEAWLYRIAAARIIDFRRRQSRRPQTELTETLTNGEPQPEEQLVQKREFALLRGAMQELPPAHQTILLLRFVENKTHQEVAEILGKSVAAVKTAQYRALGQLASLLGSEEKVRHYLRGRHE